MKNTELKSFCDSLHLDGEQIDRWAAAALLRLKKSTLMSQISTTPKTHATARGNAARPVQPQTVFIVELLLHIKEENPGKFKKLLIEAVNHGKTDKKK